MTTQTALRTRKCRAAVRTSAVQRPVAEDQDSSEPKKMKMQSYKRYQTITQSINTAVKLPFVKPLDHAARQLAAAQYLGSKLFSIVITLFLSEDRSSFAMTNEDYAAWNEIMGRPDQVNPEREPVKDPEKCGLVDMIRRSFAYVSKKHLETATFAAERNGRRLWDLLWPATDNDDDDKRPDLCGLANFVTLAAQNYYECLERHMTIGLFGQMVKYIAWKHPEWADIADKVAELLWTYLGGCYRDAARRKLVATGKLRMPVADLAGVHPDIVKFLKKEHAEFPFSLGNTCQRLQYMRHILQAFETWNESRSDLPIQDQRLVKVFALVPDVKMGVGFFDFSLPSLKEWSATKRLNLPLITEWDDFFKSEYIEKHRRKGWSLAGEHRTDGVQVHVLLEKEDTIYVNQSLVDHVEGEDGSDDNNRFGQKSKAGTFERPFEGPLDMAIPGVYCERSLRGAKDKYHQLRIAGVDPGYHTPMTVALSLEDLITNGVPFSSTDFEKKSRKDHALTKNEYYSKLRGCKSKKHRVPKPDSLLPIEAADAACHNISLKTANMSLLITAVAVHVAHFIVRFEHYSAKFFRRQRFAKDCQKRSMIDSFVDNMAPKGTLIAMGNAVRNWVFKGSTPSICLKLARAICSRRVVVLINEFHTTKMCCRCSWFDSDGVVLEKVKCSHDLSDVTRPERLRRRCHRKLLDDSGTQFDQDKLIAKRRRDIHGLVYCPSCQHYFNRDYNAAVNIGLRCAYLLQDRQITSAFINRR